MSTSPVDGGSVVYTDWEFAVTSEQNTLTLNRRRCLTGDETHPGGRDNLVIRIRGLTGYQGMETPVRDPTRKEDKVLTVNLGEIIRVTRDSVRRIRS